ncbi:hypothetical protein PNOK_0185600 [Pyrrhoderma noxium]|uniref:Uncharacterized protein n=1 Tax=Pyrrhoderma noxium TaxID=2282107 RepID=A0A286UQT2_9AGAM|nr:hypothetical protein PNOK_0185600 [Pyrrhoderma noxium]
MRLQLPKGIYTGVLNRTKSTFALIFQYRYKFWNELSDELPSAATPCTMISLNRSPKGNHYCSRDYGPSASNPNSYHYSNSNGSYYYKNSNGSTYYNNGQGSATYTPPSSK